MGWGIGIRELDFTGLAGTPHTFRQYLASDDVATDRPLLHCRAQNGRVLSSYALALLIGYSRLAIHVPPFRKSSAASHWGGRQQRIFMAAAQYCTASPCHTEKSLPPYCFLCC